MGSTFCFRLVFVCLFVGVLTACGDGTPGLAIETASAVRLRQGESASLGVTVIRSGGLTGEVTLSVEGLPAGVGADP